ncbi:MAG: hypothetical protein O2816_08555 [Planctomycetota bacterium]|nr:hypothetical protein [Planctomycetota bacterium]
MQRFLLFLAAILILWAALSASPAPESQPRWWKGNTHTHTLWSDGDSAPESVVDWYQANGYQFLVLSDHNVLQEGERWFAVSEDGSQRLKPAELKELQERYGDAVQVRDGAKGREMRLVPLQELRERFDQLREFLLVTGEEVTAHFSGEDQNYPVHINAMGIRGVIPPRGGDSVVDLMNAALDAIKEHGEEHDVPVLAHLNHPNFGWGVTWEQMAQMRADRFFEVYNGHRGVRNDGDDTRPDTETMWDLANTRRLTELDLPPLYAVATDDAHNYYGKTTAMTGRGWVQVWSDALSESALIEAMHAGDFYASSGVTLRVVSRKPGRYLIAIDEEPGVEYSVRYIGVRRAEDGTVGEPTVLAETSDNPAVYAYQGDEVFVRAVVESSRDHPNPYKAGDKETAWTQPAVPPFR